MKMRVCHVPQIPCQAFHVPVKSVAEAVRVMDILADYDLFQFENRIKPDYCNVSVLEVFDPEDDTDGPEGSWSSWYDEETGEDDPRKWMADKEDPPHEDG